MKGEGNNIDFGSRIYDSRVGRWLSTDPMQTKYPHETPYAYTSNNPIFYKDPDGQDKIVSIVVMTDKGSFTVLRQVDESFIGSRVAHYYGSISKPQTFDREITYTLDFRTDNKGEDRVRMQSSDKVRATGFSAITDYADFKGKRFSKWINSDQEKNNVQEFGFKIIGDGVKSNWQLELPIGKVTETLDLRLLLGIADLKNPNPDIKNLYDDVIKQVSKIAKLSTGVQALSTLADVQDKQGKVTGTVIDVIVTIKQEADRKKGPPVKRFTNGSSAESEKSPASNIKITPKESSDPDTIFYEKKK